MCRHSRRVAKLKPRLLFPFLLKYYYWRRDRRHFYDCLAGFLHRAKSSFSSSAPGCPACRNGTAIGGLHAADRRRHTCGRFGRRCRTRCPSRRGCAIGVRRCRTPPRPGCRSRRRNNAQSARLLHRGRAKAGSRRPSGSSYYLQA